MAKIKNKKEEIEKKLDKEEKLEEIDEDVIEEEEEDEDDSDEEELNAPMDRRLWETEKKVNAILTIVIVLMLVSFVSLVMTVNNFNVGDTSDNTSNTTSDSSSSTSSFDTSDFISISATELESLSNDNTIVVMLGRQGCSYCAAFAPILTSVASEYGITVYYIDITDIIDISVGSVIDEDALNAIANLGGSGDWETFAADNFGGTPETLVIKDNEVINGLNEYTDAATVRTMLEEAGFKATS